MLLPRILTAIVGIPLILFFVHLGSLPFLVFVVVICALATYEYDLILWLSGRGVQRWIGLVAGTAVALAVALGGSGAYEGVGALVPMAITLSLLAVLLREMFRAQHSFERAALTFFGIFFVSWTLAHLVLLRDLRPYGERWTFFLLGIIWITDMVAYFVGTTLGHRALAPVISPKKTWEGAVAGTIGAALLSMALWRWIRPSGLPFFETVCLGVLISVLGQLSDLMESVVKRASGVKDSSALLPGHGGILDRFDAFLITAPIMYYALVLRLPLPR